ncbi:hypothetical protein BDQ12DRAFT_731573 [Crucibulum laeve]|uniref:GST N-terminal domain-containing protein n=1 Tax=Crucibulum laeve TaxID=68775 RepID=A0A5C3MEB0_9AGAR|nr:hypothetical protein BDQ12DRAFT_731573 [Crucibulum laeve]
MSSTPSVILYRYDTSPFSHKIDNILVLKNIPHHKVDVSPVLPRPEITDFLGVTYRRIPILAIGNDVYCDTSLIVSALERRFPTSRGYGSIFPCVKRTGRIDTGLLKAFSKYYADTTLFPPAPSLLPWDKVPAAFVKDRSALTGGPINVNALIESRGKSLTQLSSHLALLEEQLSDGREWLFDTELPGLADISVHFIFAWIRGFRGTESLFDEAQFPNALKWLTRVSAFIEKKKADQAAPTNIKANNAADIIVSAPYEAYDFVGFDVVEAERLGLKAGDQIQVAPDDTGRNYPTVGKLVALNKEEVVIEVYGSKGLVRVHFPRLAFTARAVAKGKL